MLVIQDNAVLVLLALQAGDNLVGFLSHVAIDVLALLVVYVDVLCLTDGIAIVTLNEQVNGFLAVLHSSAGVDSWSDFEYDVTH